MIEYPPVDLAIREIGNGMWACLAIFMTIALLNYAWHWKAYFRKDATVFGALALALYFGGSSIRAVLAWGAVASLRRTYWPMDPWVSSWPWYAPSVFISVAGAAWCLWIFTPPRHHVRVMGLFFIALTIPVISYLSL